MAKKSVLELLIKLDDKLFNSKLQKVQQKLNTGVDGMKGKLNSLRDYFQRSFSNGGTALGRYFVDAFKSIPFSNLLLNPIVALS